MYTYLVVCEPNGVVAVPDVKVERDAPHDDQAHVDLQQLPADCPARPPERVGVLHHHHLPVTCIMGSVELYILHSFSQYLLGEGCFIDRLTTT